MRIASVDSRSETPGLKPILRKGDLNESTSSSIRSSMNPMKTTQFNLQEVFDFYANSSGLLEKYVFEKLANPLFD